LNSVAAPIYPGQTFATGNLAALTATGNFRSGNNGGFIGGGQIGYNWQIANVGGFGFGSGFVTGIEADIQGIAGSSGQGNYFSAASSPAFGNLWTPTNTFVATTFGTAQKQVQYIGTVRGRLGILAMPTLLVYGTGGLAYGGVNLNVGYATVDTGNPWIDHSNVAHPFGSGFGSINYSNTQVGWTAGGGLEWMLLPNWSVKAEYLYYDLGTVQASTVVSGATNTLAAATPYSPTGYAYVANTNTRFNGNIVRAGVNYHFNFGAAPVVAKY
jgi:outer membrane immunogenic protein